MPFVADEPLSLPSEKLPKLYQLPISGDWILLSDISCIRIFRETEEYKAAAMVITNSSPNNTEERFRLECDTLEEAQQIRDKIAADRNRAV